MNKQESKAAVKKIIDATPNFGPSHPKLRTAGKVVGGLALTGGAAYGGKKMYDHYSNKQKMEKAAMINSLVDEIIKIAEEEKKGPPNWAGEAADIAGFIGGAAIGSYAGDTAAHHLLKIKSPGARNFARYVGAGLAGYATMKALPHLKRNAPEAVRDMIDGGEDK